MARDRFKDQNVSFLRLHLFGDRQSQRQYAKPSSSEVAALIEGDFGNNDTTRDIIVEHKTNRLQRISELHPLYMAMQYPLLFPYGEEGYHPEIHYYVNLGTRKTKREFVAMREFYSYTIQQRDNEGKTLLCGGRLFQQYIVDAFTAIEEERLRWIKSNQAQLRSELYKNICDTVVREDTMGASVGKGIVLPSSFTSGPRYMS
ncbi:Helitron helicase-like domain [Dillenia turbinata]|uniref:Helitron helicase-like domain n=1 Tax=Dillenia turbinata TaxID=194707 RepID=A0AAN8V941_9MAGN